VKPWFINQEKPWFIKVEEPPFKNGVCCLYEGSSDNKKTTFVNKLRAGTLGLFTKNYLHLKMEFVV
jgi:hypothetical protein